MDYQCYRPLAGQNFLRMLQNVYWTQLMCRTKGIAIEDLLIILRDVEFMLKSECLYEKLFSINFFRFIIDLLDRRFLTDTKMARCLQRTMLAAYVLHPEYRCTLQELGLGEALIKVLKRETSRQDTYMIIGSRRRVNEFAPTCHLIASLFPSLEHVPHIDEVESIDIDSILYDGYSNDYLKSGEEVSVMLRVIFSAVFDVCRSRRSCLSYDILLFKLLYWAKRRCVLEHLASRKKLVDHVRSLLSSACKDKVKVGMAMVSQLASKYPELLESDATDDRVMAEQFMEKVKQPHLSRANRSRLIQSMLEFIMFSEHADILHQGYFHAYMLNLVDIDWFMKKRMYRLEIFVAAVLNMPKDVKESLIISPNGVRTFENLVNFVVQEIEDAQADDEHLKEILFDMASDPWLKIPNSPAEVNLGFVRSSAFSRVLGFSRFPEELKSDPNLRALRLASILHAVNENWGDLFCALTRGRLIDRECFVSLLVEKKILMKFQDIDSIEIPEMPSRYILEYAFLVSPETRKILSNIQFCNYFESLDTPYCDLTYSIDRSNVLDSFTRHLDNGPGCISLNPKSYWNFTFQGESATGPGPTKEFYTEFSRDVQRHDLNLWLGHPDDANSNGNQCVRSETGLFLKPLISAKSKYILEAIGKVMAQSLLFGHKLDLDFSPAFYKCLFPNASDRALLSLADIIDVMPSLSRFVESLVDALREKRAIEEYGDSITEEERTEALANITCDGCSFRDLEINFTLPGYQDVEMKDGGREICLNIHNVEEYLKLLVWWLFYKDTSNSFAYIRDGLRSHMPLCLMSIFYPDEMESIMCGIRSEQWSIKYLSEHCFVEDFPLNSPVPGYLFEVLASLTDSEQRQFLKFVTSTKRLPSGGLKALTPRLTFKCRGAMGDPDLYLPSSMTCFNLLFLTEYTSKDRLREKLLLAVREGTNSFQFL